MKKNRKQKDIIVPSCADLVIPITLVLGAYIILHGHLSPGGGFQCKGRNIKHMINGMTTFL